MEKILWRRKWQPTPVFLPGKFHGQKNLAGYSPWGHIESDTTEQLTLTDLFIVSVFLLPKFQIPGSGWICLVWDRYLSVKGVIIYGNSWRDMNRHGLWEYSTQVFSIKGNKWRRRQWHPLQCSCLENPRDGGAWWAAVYGVTQSWTRLKRLNRSSNSRIQEVIYYDDFSVFFLCTIRKYIVSKVVTLERSDKPHLAIE